MFVFKKITGTRLPPASPPSLPILGDTLKMRDYEPFMKNVFETCGSTALINLVMPTLITRHAPTVETLLKKTNYFQRLPRGEQLVGQLLGSNIVTADGEPWKKMRKLMSPPFMAAHVQGMVAAMQLEVIAMLGRWEGPVKSGTPLEMNYEMGRLALSILGRTILGVESIGENAALIGKALSVTMSQIFEDSHSLFVWRLPPTPRNLLFRYWRNRLYKLVDTIIEKRREKLKNLPEGQAEPTDLLSIMLRAAERENEPLSTVELRSQLLTMLLAGHETTATALTWTLYRISQHPTVYARLVAESAAVLNATGFTAETFSRLTYTEQVIKEAMRLDPPVPLLARWTIGEAPLGDYLLAPGMVILLPVRLIHTNPAFWTEPETFNPDRFLVTPAPGSYLPFILGPHFCLGAGFAMKEMQTVISMLLDHGCTFELAQQKIEVPVRAFRKPASLLVRVGMRI